MLAVLPLAADVAASVDLSDRTETRLRAPGDTPPNASLDVASVPEGRLSLALPRIATTLTYAPRLTFWDVGGVTAARTWLDAGSAHVEWRPDDETTLSLHEDASYGAMNFAGLTLPQGPEGAPPPRVDVIPGSQILFIESSSTTLGSRFTWRRWDLRTDVGYQVSGGADDAARSILPLQRGPFADATLTYATSPVDRVATTVTGSDTTFSSGPVIALVEGDEGWKHRWSAVTETTATLGLSEARVASSPAVAPARQTDPVAEAILETRVPAADGQVALYVDARLGPVVNRLLGIVDERVQGTVQAKWKHGPFALSAFGNAQQSVDTAGPNATTLLTGELGMSYAVVEALAFDGGVRGIWQRANQPVTPVLTPSVTDIVEANIAQWILFVGVTLRAPTIRL